MKKEWQNEEYNPKKHSMEPIKVKEYQIRGKSAFDILNYFLSKWKGFNIKIYYFFSIFIVIFLGLLIWFFWITVNGYKNSNFNAFVFAETFAYISIVLQILISLVLYFKSLKWSRHNFDLIDKLKYKEWKNYFPFFKNKYLFIDLSNIKNMEEKKRIKKEFREICEAKEIFYSFEINNPIKPNNIKDKINYKNRKFQIFKGQKIDFYRHISIKIKNNFGKIESSNYYSFFKNKIEKSWSFYGNWNWINFSMIVFFAILFISSFVFLLFSV
ncbi:hypothetical protein [Mycoplasmopsis columbina]|uniref:hypothetical protein n=1 Tax=Mycoplasmopsis columbina TaxID=114881 RepID=UPI0004A6C2C8|nr:hypothetical protein [Mycoplasmopsis columbina]VEU76876.1 Uncharacterised protein [Mycoplasmopsis columbina]